MIKYLDEIETEFEITLACLSGAQVSLNHEQNWRSKIPLNLFQVHNQIRTFFPPRSGSGQEDPDPARSLQNAHLYLPVFNFLSPPFSPSHTLSHSFSLWWVFAHPTVYCHFTLHTSHFTHNSRPSALSTPWVLNYRVLYHSTVYVVDATFQQGLGTIYCVKEYLRI